MNKQDFTVGGSKILKEAFIKQLESEKMFPFISTNPYNQIDAYEYITASRGDNYHFSGNDRKKSIHYNLPEQWNEALQAFRDYFKEDEIKGGDWIIFLKEFDGAKKGEIVKIDSITQEGKIKSRGWISYNPINSSGEGGFRWEENGYFIDEHFRKATEEEVCNYLAEKAGLKIGMKGIFNGRKFYNCQFNIEENHFHDSNGNGYIEKFMFFNNIPSILVKFKDCKYKYIFSIQDFIDNPIKREKVFTMNCDSGTYELKVGKDGIYYEPENKFLDVEALRSFLNSLLSCSISGYKFSVNTFNAGCKKNSVVNEYWEIINYYDSLQK